jgi:hypothetical protein
MSNKFWFRVHAALAVIELLLMFTVIFYPSTAKYIVVALLMRLIGLDLYVATERKS